MTNIKGTLIFAEDSTEHQFFPDQYLIEDTTITSRLQQYFIQDTTVFYLGYNNILSRMYSNNIQNTTICLGYNNISRIKQNAWDNDIQKYIQDRTVFLEITIYPG